MERLTKSKADWEAIILSALQETVSDSTLYLSRNNVIAGFEVLITNDDVGANRKRKLFITSLKNAFENSLKSSEGNGASIMEGKDHRLPSYSNTKERHSNIYSGATNKHNICDTQTTATADAGKESEAKRKNKNKIPQSFGIVKRTYGSSKCSNKCKKRKTNKLGPGFDHIFLSTTSNTESASVESNLKPSYGSVKIASGKKHSRRLITNPKSTMKRKSSSNSLEGYAKLLETQKSYFESLDKDENLNLETFAKEDQSKIEDPNLQEKQGFILSEEEEAKCKLEYKEYCQVLGDIVPPIKFKEFVRQRIILDLKS